MSIPTLFFPSMRPHLELFRPDFQRFEQDPYFAVSRMSWDGVDYVLVRERRETITGFFPELRWTIRGGEVTQVVLCWESWFSLIDDVELSHPHTFAQEWAADFGQQLHVDCDFTIWNSSRTIAAISYPARGRECAYRELVLFNPGRWSHRQEPGYFSPGCFDSPQVVERFLDECVWANVGGQWPESVGGWLARWPGIEGRWSDLDDDRQWVEAFEAVMGLVCADGRFEVFDARTEKRLRCFEEVVALVAGDVGQLRECLFVFPCALGRTP